MFFFNPCQYGLSEVKHLFMGGNRPLISLSFIVEGAKWLVCPDQGMAMVVPAPSYRQAKTARVQATYSIPVHSTPNYCLLWSRKKNPESSIFLG